ncbi:MAG: hypothetical protein CL779_02755 [Chloroflexi bacterium]|nr:hypothetical protein [Chloroflexota bacterium]|tara:strand:+ start:1591 stop:3183 length:1593 start_codon:yes stop_codon:yes gene_type:complete
MELPSRYEKARTILPKNWELLVELNKRILNYSIAGWQKEKLLERIDSIITKIEKKEYTISNIKSALKKEGIDRGISDYDEIELIRYYAKNEIYKETKDEISYLDRDELITYLIHYKSELIDLIKTITPGNQGILQLNDIVGIDDDDDDKNEASKELLYYSNPLYTIFTMIDEDHHVLHNEGWREMEDMNHSHHHKTKINPIDRWGEFVPSIHDDMVQMTKKTYDSIYNNSTEIMKIILAELFDINEINHRCNINAIVNIILHANLNEVNTDFPLYDRVKYKYSSILMELLIKSGLLPTKQIIGGVRFDIIGLHRGTAYDGKNLLSDWPTIAYGLQHIQQELNIGGAATYYDLCRPLLKQTWDDIRNLHLSEKRLNLALGNRDPSSFFNMDERTLIGMMNKQSPLPKDISNSLRRQALIGDIHNDHLSTEKRLVLGHAISHNDSLIQDIPLDIINKVLYFLSDKYYPMSEQKMSKILNTIHKRRTIEKQNTEQYNPHYAIMDRGIPGTHGVFQPSNSKIEHINDSSTSSTI